MIKYNVDEIKELDDDNKIEYFLDYLNEICSDEFFSYRKRILEQEENESTQKKKLKLLDWLSRELNNNLAEVIKNRFFTYGFDLTYDHLVLFEPNTRGYIREKFQDIVHQNSERFFTGELDTSIDTIVLEHEIRQRPDFWPYN